MAKHIKLNIEDTVGVSDTVRLWFDSPYLIIANRNRCKELLLKKERSQEDIIDILIALHIVLEVGINSTFRDVALLSIKKSVDQFKVIENIDNIDFISKTVLFIYNSNFDFSNKLDEANEYHSIIETLKDFSNMRNKLLHGHSISTLIEGSTSRHSSLKSALTESYLKKQLEKYKFIMEGMRFYISCLDLGRANIEHYEKHFLNYDFIPRRFLKEKN